MPAPAQPEQAQFSHLTEDGSVTMVDVGAKAETRRIAIAQCSVVMSPQTLALLKQQALPKGDVLTTAKLAGIMAGKRTSELIPLCHPLALDYLDVRFQVDESASAVHIETEARTSARTGVEMEALVAAQGAALTIYDMCKAVQKDLVITNCRLVKKTGGKSGDYLAPGVLL